MKIQGPSDIESMKDGPSAEEIPRIAIGLVADAVSC